MSFTTVTVTGKYLTPAGAPEVGTVSFSLSAPIMDAVGKVIRSTAPATATLDGTGAFSLALPANDDTGTVPTGTTYEVLERLSTTTRAYAVVVPHTAAAGTVDISALAPVANGSITYGVTSVNGQTGAVTVSGSGATDATTTAKGIVKLAGDLAGTADLPTVPGLAGKQAADADLTTIAALDSSTAGVLASDGAGWIRKSYAALKAALGITSGDVSGLGALATKTTIAVPGDITATGSPSASTFLRGDGAWGTPAGGTTTPLRPGLKSTLYYAAGSADGTNLNLGNGVASVLPFWFPASTTLTRLGIFLTGAASAGGVFRFFVYADDGAGYPGALISDAGTVPTTTGGTGVGLTSLSISVSGWVWIGGAQQGAPGTLATVYFTQSSQSQGAVGRDLPNLWNNATCYTQTGITGAAPGTFGTPSVGTQAYRIGAGI